jgi:hypothetical protein
MFIALAGVNGIQFLLGLLLLHCMCTDEDFSPTSPSSSSLSSSPIQKNNPNGPRRQKPLLTGMLTSLGSSALLLSVGLHFLINIRPQFISELPDSVHDYDCSSTSSVPVFSRLVSLRSHAHFLSSLSRSVTD